MRINKLEPKIFNKIAAGEVVERPASIVKELVENSIDAGANMITIKIENGGISKISIQDNGCGIHFDDLKTAFLPHATSKIKDENDLFGITTLGFRGEALASIAAVSEVSLVSKERGAIVGGRIEISGGDVTVEPKEEGTADGTEITIQNLFFNVPARAKFLKKPKTEEAEITSLVSKLILANPMVQIKYIVDGKIKLLSTGKGIKDALFVVHGKEAVENTVELDSDYGYIKIYGFVGTPAISKPNRTYQTILINNRVVENSTISASVQNAFGEMLMKKQFPLFVLYIDLDYSKVDVNVHPNKKEVRFENSSDIYVKVFEAVNRKLGTLDHTRTIETATVISEPDKKYEQKEEKTFNYVKPTESVVLTSESKANNPSSKEKAEPSSIYTHADLDYNSASKNFGAKIDSKVTDSLFQAMDILNGSPEGMEDGVRVGSRLLEELTRRMEDSKQMSMPEVGDINIKILGVLFNTYIILEKGDDMYLLDQHAGHERILFDRLNNQLKDKNVEVQRLLIPYVFSVNAEEEVFVENISANLDDIGFVLEPFGNRTFRVLSVPYMLEGINLKDFFDDILSNIKSLQSLNMKDILKDTLASKACKSAVKAGDRLSESEVKKLIFMFGEGGNKLLCPHGRPVLIKISKKEIEKWFKRIV